MFDKHLTHTVRCLFSVNDVSVAIYISFHSLHLDASISEIIGVLQYSTFHATMSDYDKSVYYK